MASPPQSQKSFWRESAELMLGALLLAMVGPGAIAETRYIPSASMQPTLEIQDKLVIEKLSDHVGLLNRGDIVVFYMPSMPAPGRFKQTLRQFSLTTEIPLIKRVIGLPGETIAVQDNQVMINGQALSEDYLKAAPVYDMPALKIPEGHVFVMGDNRNNSADSHIWGTLPIENITGKALLRFWPPERMGFLQD